MGIIRRSLRPGLYGLGLFFATFGMVALWSWGLPKVQTPPTNADAIVCLGSGVLPNGKMDSHSVARADQCVLLYHQGIAPLLAFTGAGAHPDMPQVAEQMAEHAEKSGVPRSAMVIENKSRSTLQNAIFTLDMLGPKDHLVLVTDAFHLPRAKLSFKLAGAEKISLNAAQKRPRVFNLFKETATIWFNLVRYPIYLAARQIGVDDAVALLK